MGFEQRKWNAFTVIILQRGQICVWVASYITKLDFGRSFMLFCQNERRSGGKRPCFGSRQRWIHVPICASGKAELTTEAVSSVHFGLVFFLPSTPIHRLDTPSRGWHLWCHLLVGTHGHVRIKADCCWLGNFVSGLRIFQIDKLAKANPKYLSFHCIGSGSTAIRFHSLMGSMMSKDNWLEVL